MTEYDLRDINLRTLKRIDPTIGDIIESSSQSALYTFDADNDKWFKQDYEGCLHLFERKPFTLSASGIKLTDCDGLPKYGFVILDNGSTKHYTEHVKPGALVQMIDTGSMLGTSGHNLLMFTSVTGVVHCFWFNSFDECEKMLLAMKSVAAAQTPLSNGPTQDTNNIFAFGDGNLVNGGNSVKNGGQKGHSDTKPSPQVKGAIGVVNCATATAQSSPMINGARTRTTSGCNSAKNYVHKNKNLGTGSKKKDYQLH